MIDQLHQSDASKKIKPLWNCDSMQIFFFPLPTGVLQSSFVIAKMHVDMEVCEGKVSRWEKKKRQDLAILETLNGAGHGQKTAVLQPYRAIGPRL